MIQLYIHTYSFFFSFFPHIGYQRILSRVPCAVQQVLVSYLLYICVCVYIYKIYTLIQICIYVYSVYTCIEFPVLHSRSLLSVIYIYIYMCVCVYIYNIHTTYIHVCMYVVYNTLHTYVYIHVCSVYVNPIVCMLIPSA